MALDSVGDVWTFISWGRPFRLATPAFDRTSPDAVVVQVECGWMYSCALTASGDIYVWWPFGTAMSQNYKLKMHEMDAERTKDAHATDFGIIPCACWDMESNPCRLPGLPDLPTLRHFNSTSQDQGRDETKITKIAAMDGFVMALTNQGHVLKFGDLSDELSVGQGRWQYVCSLNSFAIYVL